MKVDVKGLKCPLRECTYLQFVMVKCNYAACLYRQQRCVSVEGGNAHAPTAQREQRESDTSLKSPIDLIVSCSLNRKSPLFYTLTLVRL